MEVEVEVQPCAPKTLHRIVEEDFDELRLRDLIADGSLSFDDWTSLISAVENVYPDHIEKLCWVYESFLSKFPLCHGYWRRYADHKMRLCSVDKVVEVFEKAVLSATYSVDVWVDYCHFGMLAFEDPADIRRLFSRGLSFVGRDYLCYCLWDKYIEFELSQQQWSYLAHIYVQTLRFPTKKLQHYYDSFKKLVTLWKEEIVGKDDSDSGVNPEIDGENKVLTSYRDEEIAVITKDLLGSSSDLVRSRALRWYINIGEKLHKESRRVDEKIHCFESCIRRSYFHIKPLDNNQLVNWHQYLDFVEKQEDFDWAAKLYERCLIPAANYPEFWMRYVHFAESKGGRELANYALDRAVGVFLKHMPVIHAFNARFKEKIGDLPGARAALVHVSIRSDTEFVENAVMKANMEKRWGNLVAASNIYKETLEKAISNRMLHCLSTLYLHYSQHLYLTTGSADEAIGVLVDGIKHLPQCKLLYEELIKFAMTHGGIEHKDIMETVITKALYFGTNESQLLDLRDREDISYLYLKFIDFCGTTHDIMKVWDWHVRKFPHSLRTTSVFEPNTNKKTYKITMEEKQRTCLTDPHKPLVDHGMDIPKDHTPQQMGTSAPETCHPLIEQADAQISSSTPSENHNSRSGTVVIQHHIPGSTDECKNQRDQVTRAHAHALEHSRDNSPKADGAYVDVGDQAAKEAVCVQADPTYSKDNIQSRSDLSDKELVPLFLETLSLDPLEDRPRCSISNFSHEDETFEEPRVSNEILLVGGSQETSMSRESLLGGGHRSHQDPCSFSPSGSQASDGADARRRTVNASFSVDNRDLNSSESHTKWQEHASRGRNWRRMNNDDRVRRDSRFGFRGNLRKRSVHRQEPSQLRHEGSELGSQNRRQGFEAENQFQAAGQGNLMASKAWPMQNVQPQTLVHGYQSQMHEQSVTYPQAQAFQYPSQSHEQYGHMQNNQAYDQMWQYYYYQQQQQFVQQQQLQVAQLQPEQQQLQAVQLQPEQQQQQSQHQLLSQQPYQQQQLFYLQQWQQQLHQQYQPLQLQPLQQQQLNNPQQLQQPELPPQQQHPLQQQLDPQDGLQVKYQNLESDMHQAQQKKMQQGAEVQEKSEGGVHEALDPPPEI